MKINIEKVVEVLINVFAIGVGILLVTTVSVMAYAMLKSIFF